MSHRQRQANQWLPLLARCEGDITFWNNQTVDGHVGSPRTVLDRARGSPKNRGQLGPDKMKWNHTKQGWTQPIPDPSGKRGQVELC